jgi:hypothetical protein
MIDMVEAPLAKLAPRDRLGLRGELRRDGLLQQQHKTGANVQNFR